MTNDELLRDCESVLGRDWTKKRKQVVEFLVNAIAARAGRKDVSEKSRPRRTTELTGILVVRDITNFKYSKPVLHVSVQEGSVRVGDKFSVATAAGICTGTVLVVTRKEAAVYKALIGEECSLVLNSNGYTPIIGDEIHVMHKSAYKPR